MPVRVCTHTCVRGGHIPSRARERAIAPSARPLSATTVHRQKRKGHYTEIAYRLRVSVQEGLQAQPADGPRLESAQILVSAARGISKWELKGTDISATRCKEKRQLKCQTTAETKPKEEQLKDQPENSLKPCQKSSLATEQVRTAAVVNAAENTHSTFEGRDSGFSPAPKATSSGIDPC